MEPFQAWDPTQQITQRKKLFNENFRPLRSKINLNIGGEEAKKFKRTNLVTVDSKFLQDFDIKFAETCDSNKMRKKNTSVQESSPFHHLNKPPA